MTSNEIKHLIVVLDGANLAQVGDDRIRETISHAVVEGVGNALTVRLVRDLLIARAALGMLETDNRVLVDGVMIMWRALSFIAQPVCAGSSGRAKVAIRYSAPARAIASAATGEGIEDSDPSAVIRSTLGLQPGASVTETVQVLVEEHHAMATGVMALWRSLTTIWEHGDVKLAKIAIDRSAKVRAMASAITADGSESSIPSPEPDLRATLNTLQERLRAALSAYEADDGNASEAGQGLAMEVQGALAEPDSTIEKRHPWTVDSLARGF